MALTLEDPKLAGLPTVNRRTDEQQVPSKNPEWVFQSEQPALVKKIRSPRGTDAVPSDSPAYPTSLTIAASEEPAPLLVGEFEQSYRKFGVWNGPYGSGHGTRAEVAEWRRRGMGGVYWLIGRIRYETNTNVLNGVAAVLSELPDIAFDPMLRTLKSGPENEQAYALLLAISWMPQAATDQEVKRLALAIQEMFRRDDVDVREAAVSASRMLPASDALSVLRTALLSEADTIVRDAIAAEIEARETE